MSNTVHIAASPAVDSADDVGTKRLQWLVGLIAALLLASAVPAILQLRRLTEYQALVRQSSEVRERAEHLRAVVGRAWATVQASVSQGLPLAEAVLQVRRTTQAQLAELLATERGHPRQSAPVERLEVAIERRLEVLQALFRGSRERGVAPLGGDEATMSGLVESVAAVDLAIDALLESEQQLLAERERGFAQAVRAQLAAELVGVALSLVLLVLAFRLAHKDARRRQKAADSALRVRDQLAQANRSLLGVVDERSQALALRNDALMRAHERLSLLSRQLLGVVEQERRALARELHDDFGQLLTTLKMRLKLLREGDRAQELDECVQMVEDGVTRVRERAFALRPAELDEIGLASALRSHAQKEMRHGRVQISVQVQADLEAERGEWATAVFRIVQEALRNALQHGRPQHIVIQVDHQHDGGQRLRVLSVRDDGSGLARGGSEKPRLGGLGLVTMRERTELLGGRFEIGNLEPHGTIVRCTWPVGERSGPAPD